MIFILGYSFFFLLTFIFFLTRFLSFTYNVFSYSNQLKMIRDGLCIKNFVKIVEKKLETYNGFHFGICVSCKRWKKRKVHFAYTKFQNFFSVRHLLNANNIYLADNCQKGDIFWNFLYSKWNITNKNKR